jgi:hypothetical protein
MRHERFTYLWNVSEVPEDHEWVTIVDQDTGVAYSMFNVPPYPIPRWNVMDASSEGWLP